MKKLYPKIASLLVIVLTLSLLSVTSFALTKTNQDSTAYTWTGNRTASGVWPEVGYCAVHPTVSGGSTPKISYGTVLYIDKVVNEYSPFEEWDMLYHPTYGEMTAVQVQDLGDTSFTRKITLAGGVWHYLSAYWIDLYWGDDPDEGYDYGARYIDYHD